MFVKMLREANSLGKHNIYYPFAIGTSVATTKICTSNRLKCSPAFHAIFAKPFPKAPCSKTKYYAVPTRQISNGVIDLYNPTTFVITSNEEIGSNPIYYFIRQNSIEVQC